VSKLLPVTRIAYHAQQTALRLSLLTAHLGLRPFVPRKRRPNKRELAELRRRLRALLERDVDNVAAGLYGEELLFSLPVREYLSGLPKLAVEVARMVRRARKGRVRDFSGEVELAAYPAYFRRNFHWQTDGYLSRRSAELYDLGVEFLFLGTADVMRRQAIAPLARELRARAERRRVLDIACGTGRLLDQLARALPAHDYTGVDLSPYYVERARELLAGTGVTLLTGNAEALPFADRSFDAITSVFLFHELPLRARRAVLAEMRRVLSDGGLVVIEDAAQLSDAPGLEVFLENFGRDMNEPFFLDYLRWDLERELGLAGFTVEQVAPAFLSKVVVARATSESRGELEDPAYRA
jgi:ubiquinone/menaquinone biosynthesis C-methylase UbiE